MKIGKKFDRLWRLIDEEREAEAAILFVQMTRVAGSSHPGLQRAAELMHLLFWS